MTRATTWSNPDGLVVGFGPNYPERKDAGDVKTFGAIKQAVVDVTYQSTFGAAGAGFTLPVNAIVHKVWFESKTDWVTADAGTLSVGDDSEDTDDVDGWITATALTAAAMGADTVHPADGVYAVGNNADNASNPQARTVGFGLSVGATIYFTKANNFTAGTGRLIIQYSN